MKAVIPLLGWAIFLYGAIHFVSSKGSQWEFGRYYMPRTLVAADGCCYPDGEPIPLPILALVRADIEEEVTLALVGVEMAALVWLGVEMRKLHRARREYREMFGREFTGN